MLCLPSVGKGIPCGSCSSDNNPFDQQPWLRSRNGITHLAVLSVVLVTTSVSAVVLCGIRVDLPLAWD